MHLHNRVLGLVDRRFEYGLVALQLPGRGVGTRCGIVVTVAVERAQLVGDAAEQCRQRLVGGDCISPYGVATDRGGNKAIVSYALTTASPLTP